MSSLVQDAGSVSVDPDAIKVEHVDRISPSDALIAGSASLGRFEGGELTLLCSSDTEALLQRLPPTPVPRLQLAALCLARLADPITFTQV